MGHLLLTVSGGVGQFFRTMHSNVRTAGEVLALLWAHRLWWLIPMVSVLLLLGLLLVVATVSGVGPFIYTLF